MKGLNEKEKGRCNMGICARMEEASMYPFCRRTSSGGHCIEVIGYISQTFPAWVCRSGRFDLVGFGVGLVCIQLYVKVIDTVYLPWRARLS